jgi:small subunit ribosomal protein S8
MARKAMVVLPYSNFKHSLAKLLEAEGYIQKVEVAEKTADTLMKTLVLGLKYDTTGAPVISEIKRVSKPGQRIYSGRMDIPSVMGGSGTTIISTSKGLMTDKQARKNKIGGEIVCQIW